MEIILTYKGNADIRLEIFKKNTNRLLRWINTLQEDADGRMWLEKQPNKITAKISDCLNCDFEIILYIYGSIIGLSEIEVQILQRSQEVALGIVPPDSFKCDSNAFHMFDIKIPTNNYETVVVDEIMEDMSYLEYLDERGLNYGFTQINEWIN